jgi:hypothetical protein
MWGSILLLKNHSRFVLDKTIKYDRIKVEQRRKTMCKTCGGKTQELRNPKTGVVYVVCVACKSGEKK